MKKFLKNLIFFIFLLAIAGGTVAGIYYYSPEVKPGEVGLLYKTIGNDRGFTGKVLTPGKYYCFITEFNPFVNKIYKFKLFSKTLKLSENYPPGVLINYSVVYEVKNDKIGDFVRKVNKNEVNKIVTLYLNSAFKLALLKMKINEIFKNGFQPSLISTVKNNVNKELDYFGLVIDKIDITSLKPDSNLKDIYDNLKEKEKELAKMQAEIEKKLKEEAFKNKIKEQELQYLLKKAETENTITKLKTESMKLLREEDKKRMLEEVDIFSKPGGALAAKLEAIRVLSKTVKNPEQVLEKVNNVFEK
jgi:hypothetical protein